jgi:hypothetical protein
MAEKTGLERFEEILREMRSLLFDGLTRVMEGKQWRHAFVDIRRAADEPTMISKLRVVLPDSSIISLLKTPLARTPTEVLTLCEELWETKPSCSWINGTA